MPERSNFGMPQKGAPVGAPKYTAETIFRYAEEYSAAANALRIRVDRSHKPAIRVKLYVPDAGILAPPAMVEAFAVELYFKCLLTLDWGKAPRGHKVKDELFDKLKPATQQSLRWIYNNQLKTDAGAKAFAKLHPRIPMGLDTCLSLYNDVFETIRYAYEEKRITVGAWAILNSALRATILAIRPDWEKKESPDRTSPTSPAR
jgi:hypothetical protein